MLKNYLKVALRSLFKRKAFTLINILGLATGMAICLMIILFIKSETGYDASHKKADRIYRVVLERRYPDRSSHYSFIPQTIGEAIRREFPEVEESTRLFNFLGNGQFFVRVGDKIFEESKVLLADSNFFRVFTVNLLQGDANALMKPNTVVLNETTAKKYFGSVEKAFGKFLITDGDNNLQVSAVTADWPLNSHFSYDLLISTATFQNTRQPNYISFSAHTYLLLNPNANAAALQEKFSHIIKKYVSGEIQQNFGQSYADFIAAGNGYNYYLQPLKKIHLTSDLEGELSANGSLKTVYIFSLVALFILVIACTNFINLSTARSLERAREVGIRKTFGSLRKSLMTQFLIESVLVSLFSMICAAALIFLLLPLFNQLTGKSLQISDLISVSNIFFLLFFSTLVGLLAGTYPAFVLSSFNPIVVLKGSFKSNKVGLALRNGLVVFQFAITVVLIISAIIVNRQVNYMSGDKLGFKKDYIIIVERTDLVGDQTKAFKTELQKIAGVENVTGTTAMPGQQNYFGFSVQTLGSTEQMTGRAVITDPQFASTLDLQIIEGRFLSKDFSTDTLAMVLNEKAVEELKLKDPIGKILTVPDENFNAADGTILQYKVVGVTKDFHFQSLQQKIVPLIFLHAGRFGERMPVTAVRIKGDHFNSTIKNIESIWKKFVPARPFNYSFFDQQLKNQYLAEQTMQKIFTVFSSLAIFIACLGLLGLAAYTTQQRLREISIRKVLGAGMGNIFMLLSTDFLKLVLFATLIAFPVAWWAMYSWLGDYAYRINIGWEVFVIAGGLALLIAMFTISYQAVKASVQSPVKSLRMD